MPKNYNEYLKSELEKAISNFEETKKEAAREIETMTYFEATDFGAAYASRIDKVTEAAAKIRAIAEAINAYEYFEREGIKNEAE